jgi:hypothetical protein
MGDRAQLTHLSTALVALEEVRAEHSAFRVVEPAHNM